MRLSAIAWLVTLGSAWPALANEPTTATTATTATTTTVAPLAVLRPPVLSPAPQPERDRLLLKVSLGGAYQLMLGESAGGADLEIEVGLEDKHWGAAAQLGMIVGQMRGGLPFIWSRFGPGFDLHLGRRFRLGLGIAVGELAIARAVGGFQNAMLSPTMGTHVDFSVDLVRGKRSGVFYLTVRVGADAIVAVDNLTAGSFLLSSTLGYRY